MVNSGQPVWLITGAAGALGSAMTRRIMTGGADVVALDRDAPTLNRLHDGLARTGRPPALMPLDLVGAGPDDYARLAEAIGEQFGRLDVLVHNAAHFVALRPLEHQSAEEWMKSVQAGLTGPFLLTQALLPLLRESDGARIVFVGDSHCLDKPANWGAYGMSQAGRRWLGEAWRAELGPRGPRVMELDPGVFYSPLRAAAWPAEDPGQLPTADSAAADLIEQINRGVQ
jgi:NAD(P)-dependent dehydrogenase (short-subunit alcohol dehydrogenase family)